MAEDVVVDSRLVEKPSVADERVDRNPCRIRASKQRRTVDLAQHASVGFDDTVWPDYLQVEDETTGHDRLHHVAQDVHDVLGLDASERPREDSEVERMRLDLERLSRGDEEADVIA